MKIQLHTVSQSYQIDLTTVMYVRGFMYSQLHLSQNSFIYKLSFHIAAKAHTQTISNKYNKFVT